MTASIDPGEGPDVGLEAKLDIRLGPPDGADSAVLEVSGEVDLATVEQFRDALVQAQRSPRVLVDMSGVTFIDSAGLNALVGAYHRTSPGGQLRLVGLRSNVQRVLEITGLLALLEHEPEEHGSPASGQFS